MGKREMVLKVKEAKNGSQGKRKQEISIKVWSSQ
jgi:hypothetical protein